MPWASFAVACLEPGRAAVLASRNSFPRRGFAWGWVGYSRDGRAHLVAAAFESEQSISESIATLACGVFFGAALYISVVQHPAMLEAGVPFAARFFGPMYRRASVLQVTAAILGTLAAALAWYRGAGVAWLIGALLLFAVIPFTLVAIMPVNHQLLAPERDPASADTKPLLRRWATLHAVRTALGGIAFLLFLLGAS